MRRPLVATALTTAAALAASLTAVPAADAQQADQAADLGSRFTLGVMPDTQFYSRYATEETGNLAAGRYGSEPYRTQTEWLAEHHDELNMPFVTHLGDVVDQPEVAAEWDVADDAMGVLEQAGLDYSILPGNHDMYDYEDPAPFLEHFPAERAARNSTFGGRHEAADVGEYHVFHAEGQDWLVLALGWRSDDATLDWAQSVLDEHPGLPTILTTHEVLQISGTGEVSYSEEYGRSLFDKLIAPNDQIFLTMGGHHHGAGVRVDTNDAGHDVVAVLQDYQMAYQGGNGLLGTLQFDLSAGRLDMTALSPWVAQKPHEKLTQFDELILEDEADSWSVPLDFAERFAGFAPDWTPGQPDDPDYAERARQIVAQGFRPYEVTEAGLPQGPQDYAHNDRTVAHWRPGRMTVDGSAPEDGQTLPARTEIPDVAGRSPLARTPMTRGGYPDQVTYSTEHHPLSSDTGSVRFNDPRGNLAVSYFSTAADATVNSEQFEDGYTFETFIKIDPAYADENNWMSAFVRDGRVKDVKPEVDDTDPPVLFSVSSLRELRWYSLPSVGEPAGGTNWTHEVPLDRWMHVAVVSDPQTRTVEMFVDGAPILRDQIGYTGLAGDLPWIMGASMSDGAPEQSWYGWIGETRLTSGVLPADQWLTARAGAGAAGDAAQPGTGGAGNGGAAPGSSAGDFAGGFFAGLAALAGILGLLARPLWDWLAAQPGVQLPQPPRLSA